MPTWSSKSVTALAADEKITLSKQIVLTFENRNKSKLKIQRSNTKKKQKNIIFGTYRLMTKNHTICNQSVIAQLSCPKVSVAYVLFYLAIDYCI